MREVEVSRFVAATAPEVARALDPAALVAYEGSFEVREVTEEGEGTLVTAGGPGLEMTLWFRPEDDGWYYEQAGEAGPFDAMWTRVRTEPEDDGARVTARSGVSLGLPLAALTDRVAAWKRRGELRRALRNLADDLG